MKNNMILKMFIIANLFCCVNNGMDINASQTLNENRVISEALVEELNDDENDVIPVWIVLNNENEEQIISDIEEELKVTVDSYTDSKKFYDKIVPKLKEKVIQEYGKITASEPIEIVGYSTQREVNMYNATMSDDKVVKKTLIDIEINNSIDSFVNVSREKAKSYYEVSNKNILKQLNLSEDNICYISKYAPVIIAQVDKNKIIELSENEFVTQLDYYKNNYENNSVTGSIHLEQTDIVDETGTKYDVEGGWTGHTGWGVTVGIQEVGGVVEKNHEMFIGLDNLSVLSPVEVDGYENFINYNNHHAELVTSIICGNRVLFNDKWYEGILTAAEVYEVPFSPNNIGQELENLELLIDYGANVINMSYYLHPNNDEPSYVYSAQDYYHDLLINNRHVTLVVAAGNGGLNAYPATPANSFNSIIVGNADTISYDGNTLTAKSKQYLVDSTSSSNEYSYVPNRPDVVAPGNNISYIKSNSLYLNSGTSFAAPIVTGMIAQMMEADPQLKTNPSKVKALVCMSAQSSYMSAYYDINANGTADSNDYYNTAVNYGMREYSGCGFMDATVLLTNTYYNQTNSSSFSTVVSSNYITSGVTLQGGKKLRACMNYNKTNSLTSISSLNDRDDLDLVLLDANMNELISYPSNTNNVEILEYTVPQTGTYYFKIKVNNIYDESKPPYVSIVYKQ